MSIPMKRPGAVVRDAEIKRLSWQLMSYAEICIRSDWTNEAKGDREWAAALALAIDKFAKDWVADNCPGRALANKEGK